MEDKQCALVALRFEEAIPRDVSAAGFWFEFYGFATYNALINPSDPVARAVLETMDDGKDSVHAFTQAWP